MSISAWLVECFSENRIGVHATICVSPGSCRGYYEVVSQLVYLG